MELKNKEPVKKESRSEKNRARWDHVAKRNQGRSALERSDGNSKVYIYIYTLYSEHDFRPGTLSAISLICGKWLVTQ